MAEEVLDNLPEPGHVTSATIAEVKAKDDAKEELSRTMEVVSNKVKATETRNKPNQMLSKAIDYVDSIDPRIVKKLNEDQIDELKENVSRLEEMLSELKESLQ